MSKDIDDDAETLQHEDSEDKMDISANVEILEDSNQIDFATEDGEDEFIDEAFATPQIITATKGAQEFKVRSIDTDGVTH